MNVKNDHNLRRKRFSQFLGALLSLSLIVQPSLSAFADDEVPEDETAEEIPEEEETETVEIPEAPEEEGESAWVVQKGILVNGVERENPMVKAGDVVTFRYEVRSGSVPAELISPLDPVLRFYEASITSDDQNLVLYSAGENPVRSDLGSIQHGAISGRFTQLLEGVANSEEGNAAVLFSLKENTNAVLEISAMVSDTYGELLREGLNLRLSSQVLLRDGDETAASEVRYISLSPDFIELEDMHDGDIVREGDILSYRIWITNPSEESISVTVDDFIEKGLVFEKASIEDLHLGAADPKVSNDSYSLDFDGLTLSAEIASLAPGQVIALNVETSVSSEAAESGTVTNRAIIHTPDGDIRTNTIQNPLPGQQIGEVSPGNHEAIEEGEHIIYRIYYQNETGSSRDVSIVNPLDPSVSYIGSISKGQLVSSGFGALSEEGIENASYNSGVVEWMLSDIEPKGSGFVVLSVAADAPGEEPVTSQAMVQVADREWESTSITTNPFIMMQADLSDLTLEQTAINSRTLSSSDFTSGTNNSVSGPGIQAGDELTFEMEVPASASELVITDKIDYYTEFVSASYGDVTLDAESSSKEASSGGVTIRYESNGTVTWTIPAGNADTLELKVAVGSLVYLDRALAIENQASISEGGAAAEKTGTITNPIYPRVTVSSSGSSQSVSVGNRISYEIGYVNNTSSTADVLVFMPVPVGTNFVSAEIPSSSGASITAQNPSYPSSGTPVLQYDANKLTATSFGGLSLNFPSGWEYTLRNGTKYTGYVMALVEDAPAGAGTISMQVEVNANASSISSSDGEAPAVTAQALVQTGSNLANYSTPASSTMDGLSLGMSQQITDTGSLTMENLSVEKGNKVTYSVEVVNSTSSDLSNIAVSDVLSDGLDLVEGSITSGGAYTSSSRTVSWTVASLPKGEKTTLSFQVTVASSNASTLTNQAKALYSYGNESDVESLSPTLTLNVTQSSTTTTTPSQNTGNETNTTMLIVVFVLAAVVLAGVGYYWYRKRNK